MGEELLVTESPGGAVFALRVIPRAGRSAIAGARNGAIVLRLAAAPVDDAANDALVAFFAAVLEVPKRHITIQAGRKSRDKRLRVAGFTREQLHARLSAILPR